MLAAQRAGFGVTSMEPMAPMNCELDGEGDGPTGLSSFLADPAVVAEQYRSGFRAGDLPTVGLEEELMLVDVATLDPVDSIDGVFDRLRSPLFAREFATAQLELVIPPHLTVADLRRELAGARAEVVAATQGDARLLAAGSHPSSTRPVLVTDLPRYQMIGLDYPWATRRGLPCGLHVHVAIDDPDAALAVYNACRGWLPELAALAANSPFYQGADSGLASTRLKLIEDMPRAGIPPAFESWQELAEFATWGTGAGLFPDLSYLWWDLRLRPEYGTLEFRVADAQTGIDASTAIAAICQSLVAALRVRLDAGEPLPVYRTHILNENRWRALRDGLDATLVDPATGVPEPGRSRLARFLEMLEPHAAEVGCADELAHAWPLLAGDGATRQREVAEERGVGGLLAWLVDETEQPDASPLKARGEVESR